MAKETYIGGDWTRPAVGGGPITPDDSTDLAKSTRGLMVGVAGDVKVTTYDGSVMTLPALVAGIIHPIAVVRVWATGTTATSIKAIY